MKTLFSVLLSMVLFMGAIAIALAEEAGFGLEQSAIATVTDSTVVVSAERTPFLLGTPARASPASLEAIMAAKANPTMNTTHVQVSATDVPNLRQTLEAGATHPVSRLSLGFNGFGRVIRI